MPPSLSAAEARALMGSEAAAPGDGLAGLRVGAHLSSSARRRGGRGSRAKRHGEDGYGKPVGGTAKGPEWRSSPAAAAGVLRRHPVPALFGCGLLFFMGVEYTIPMVAPAAPPLDLGFAVTAALHAGLTARPALNSFCAALNTVFVAMQAAYILWAILAEGRPRAAIAAVMMFTCRGVLGCSTQLPLPEGFLGSGMDFPVGNVSFFLFFSGHVAGAVIASTDMRRVGRHGMARLYDALNLLQGVRLLASRGHYTIDLAVGVGAGLLFDMLAGRYLESKTTEQAPERHCCSCHRTLLAAAS